TLDNLLGSARLALVERFADAQDRNEPRLLRRLELLGDDRVALAEQRTALRVADDGVAAPDVGQHRAGYFAGERPAADPRRDVLRPEQDVAAREPVRDGLQVRIRRAEQHLRAALLARDERRDERIDRRERSMHLPV